MEAEADRFFEWILSQDAELHAPDLLPLEIAQVLWKKRRASELVQSEVTEAMAELAALPLQFHGSRRFLSETVAIACKLDRTVYDSTYLAPCGSSRLRIRYGGRTPAKRCPADRVAGFKSVGSVNGPIKSPEPTDRP